MSILFKKPYIPFFIAAPILLLTGLLDSDSTLDINIHDTYFIIDYFHLSIVMSLFFSLIGVGYLIMKKKTLSIWLNRIHIGVTFGGIITVKILILLLNIEMMESTLNFILIFIIWSIVLFIVLIQIIFPINIIYGLIKSNKS